ncbi:facilitated trehalose transporter Tret1 [Dendroctonus ponderosae]
MSETKEHPRVVPYRYNVVAGSEEDAKKGSEGQVDIQIGKIDALPPSRAFLYIAACTGNLAAFTCGITLGWTSPVLPKLQDLSLSPLSEVVSVSDAGWIGSLLPLGASLGPFIVGAAADKIGRKKTLLLGNIPFIVGFLLNIMATNVYYLLVSRFICGVSVGLTFTVLPMYTGEIAEDEVRGTLGTYLQLFTVIGLLFSFVLGPYIPVTLFNAACIVVPSIFLVAFFFFIPESPSFLLSVGETDAAEQALMKLRNRSAPSEVREELQAMLVEVNKSLDSKGSFMDIFKSKGLLKAYLLSNGLLVFQQVSGINVVLFFAQTIFQDAGVAMKPELCTIMIGVVQVVFTGLTSGLIDKQGKRLLLMLSAVGMTVAQGGLAYYFYLKDSDSDVSAFTWLPIACLIGYIITFCLGFGPIPWAVMGEMFPANVKSVASMTTGATCWFLAFLLTKYFSAVVGLIGKAGSFGLFGGCCALAFAFVYKFLPETKGKSLQEIQDMLSGKS